MFFQARNLMEFLQMVHDLVEEGDEVTVHLITQSDPDNCVKQEKNLNSIMESFTGSKVAFTWEFDHSSNFHARSITADSGWKITMDRGLDIFQKYESGPFSLEPAMQEMRLTRGVEVSYVRVEGTSHGAAGKPFSRDARMPHPETPRCGRAFCGPRARAGTGSSSPNSSDWV